MVMKRFNNLGPARRVMIRGAASGGLRLARNLIRKRIQQRRTENSRQKTAPLPLTGENDVESTYRRRRMPGRRRRRWVQFNRKVNTVIQKNLGSNHSIIVRSAVHASVADKQVIFDGHVALGLNGASGVYNDVAQLMNLGLAPGYWSAIERGKIQIKGWMAETQMVNTAGFTAYVDLYYWRCKRDVPFVSGVITGMTDFMVEGLGDLRPLFPIGGSTLSTTDYGFTPFQCPQFSKSITIWKKVRVKLAPGGVAQFTTRSSKNYRIAFDRAEHFVAMRGITEGVIGICYGQPGPVNTIAEPINIQFTTNVNYTWSALQSSEFGGGTNRL
nr:MAG: capsid protein [Virus sp.]